MTVRRIEKMSQVSPAKVKVKEIHHLAVAVKDMQKSMENYWNILGIGPWMVFPWESPTVYDRKYYGKQSPSGRDRIALAQVGNVMLELVQSLEGDSIYKDFLKEHGEGLHHCGILVDDVDGAAAMLGEQGFPSIQSGHFGAAEYGCGFNYVDTSRSLGAFWEPVHLDDNVPLDPLVIARYPEG